MDWVAQAVPRTPLRGCPLGGIASTLGYRLAPLTASLFPAVIRQAVLPLTLECFFGAAGFVLNTSQRRLTLYRHYESSRGLMANKQ